MMSQKCRELNNSYHPQNKRVKIRASFLLIAAYSLLWSPGEALQRPCFFESFICMVNDSTKERADCGSGSVLGPYPRGPRKETTLC